MRDRPHAGAPGQRARSTHVDPVVVTTDSETTDASNQPKNRHRRRFSRDDRAVSVTVGYALTLAISAMLLTGLFVAGGSFLQSEREVAIEGELTVVGERLVADLLTVDRLASGSTNSTEVTAEVATELPGRVTGTAYTVTVEPGADGQVLRLETDRPQVVVIVPFRTAAAVEATTVDGGDVVVRWDPGAESVVIDG